MKRTLVYGLTVLALVLAIGACAPAPAPTAVPAQPTAAPAQPTAAPAQPTAAPAQPTAATTTADEWGDVVIKKGDTIKASFSAAMTGDLALFGQDMQIGAQLGASKFGGDIDGFKLEIVTEDDLCSGPGGTTIANKIVANPAIVGQIGFMCSSGEIPGTEILDKAHVVSISPSATAVQVTARGLATVNRTAFNDKIQGPADANFVLKELKLTKAATMHDGSPYGQGLAEAFAEAFKANGGTIVGDMEAITVGEKDFRATLTKIAANGPEIIFFGGFWPEAAVIATQKSEVGMKDVVLMSADGTFSQDLIKAIPDAAQGIYASFGSSQQGASYAQFLKDYAAAGGDPKNIVFSPQTYDAVNVLSDALKASAKVDADGNLVVGRKALAEAVRKVKIDGVTGAISFDATGDRPPESTNVIINKVEGDKWVQVYPKPEATGTTGPDEWGDVVVKKGDTIKASFSAAMTGDLALFGQDMQIGAQLGASKFGGDIDGFKLEIVTEDDLCSGPGGTTIANKIVANPAIVGQIGFMCSSGEIPGTEILDKAHVVSISPSATAVQVTARGLATVNRTAFNDKIQGPADANFVLKELKLTKAATMHDGSPYGQGLAEAFAEAFKASGGTIVGDMEAVTVGEKDFRATLTKIAANSPEIIFFGGFWPEAAVIATQKSEVGMKDVVLMSADGTFSQDLIKAIPDAAQGIYASFGSSQQGASYAQFLKDYAAAGGDPKNIVFSPQTYDAVNVLSDALKAV
ncbi:MAG: hypothetical protein B6D41_09735, partial [Chloroflexi bacterium UTCFX4]